MIVLAARAREYSPIKTCTSIVERRVKWFVWKKLSEFTYVYVHVDAPQQPRRDGITSVYGGKKAGERNHVLEQGKGATNEHKN